MRVALLWVVLAACARPQSVTCEFGTCPGETHCDELHQQCVSDEQLAQCRGRSDLERCTAVSGGGRCDGEVCIAMCGDGVRNLQEECDDGDYASHDGCSSTCRLESPVWTQWQSAWSPRMFHAAAYDSVRGTLAVVGGLGIDGPRPEHWIRDSARAWKRVAAPPVAALISGTLAFDSARGRLVLFGGRTGGGEDGATDLSSAETWEHDGTQWMKRTPTAFPSARHGAAMTFDKSTNRIVLFGGRTMTEAFTNDTWEYDGTTWTQIAMTSPPAVRRYASLAYDDTRQRLVLFGGIGTGGAYNDTLELVAGQWTVATGITTKPSQRFGAAMQYSASRGRIVLFGGDTVAGPLGDTWEYSDTGWVQVAATISPPGRAYAQLAYDTAANALVLVAGRGVATTLGLLDDIWEYTCAGACSATSTTAGSWVSRPPAVTPPGRSRSAIVYDDVQKRAIIIGGYSTTIKQYPDAWQFSGGEWSLLALNPSPTPTPRREHMMAFDSKRNRIVIFGGAYESTTLADTWETDGVNWYAGPAGPPAAHAGGIAYAADDGVVVMSGGLGEQNVESTDTWEYDGTAWRQISGEGPPCCSNMTYDPVTQRIVYLAGAIGETWVYDDHVWQKLESASVPTPRSRHASAFDPRRGRVVIFGGRDVATSASFNDVWELGPDDNWHEVDVLGSRPTGRKETTLAALPEAKSLLLFGGEAAGSHVGDTWMFQYRSSEADEICTGGVDDDLDRLVDCDDPDCDC